jgi:AcrR family transcriptional regulator
LLQHREDVIEPEEPVVDLAKAMPSADDAPEHDPTEDLGPRERHRIERTREFLDTALKIVTSEGFDALTMSRLAGEVDAAIGAVYRYFPSKGAILAAVQRESINHLSASLAVITTTAEDFFDEIELEPKRRALARLVLSSRFFISAADTLPEELRLLQMLVSEFRNIIPTEEVVRSVPAAMGLLFEARQTIVGAEESGVISPGDATDRALVWAAGVNGVLQMSMLDQYDADLFSGTRLARTFTNDLIRGWGADHEMLAEVSRLIDEDLGSRGPLAPPRPAWSHT